MDIFAATWAISAQAADQLSAAGPSALMKLLSGEDSEQRRYAIHGTTAVIDVQGMLLSGQASGGFFFRRTGYGFIAAAVREADADDAVDEILLMIDSGGGLVHGELRVAVDAIRGASKMVRSHITNIGCSAAMPIAMAARGGVTASPFALVGSLGVMTTFVQVEREAVKVRQHNFVSGLTPKKAPLPGSDDFAAQKQEQLDGIAQEFLGLIGELRGIDGGAEVVAKRYGEGRAVVAAEGLRMGLIDGVQTIDISSFNRGGYAAAAHAGVHTMPDTNGGALGSDMEALKAQLESATAQAQAAQQGLSATQAELATWKAQAGAAIARAERAEEGLTAMRAQVEQASADAAAAKKSALEVAAGAEFDRLVEANDFTADEKAGFVEARVAKATGDAVLGSFFDKCYGPRIGKGLAAGIPGGTGPRVTHGDKPDESTARKPGEIKAMIKARIGEGVDYSTALRQLKQEGKIR